MNVGLEAFPILGLMWVVTILPWAFIPLWVHPMVRRSPADRQDFKKFMASVLVSTWLLAAVIAAVFGQGWAGWVWLATVGLCGTLTVRSVRARVKLARTNRRVEARFRAELAGL